MNDEFIECIRQLKPAHQKDAIKDIFSWKEFERIINLRPFVSASRLKFVSCDEQSWPAQDWLSDVNTYPPNLIKNLLKDKMGYFRDCTRVNSKINNIAKTLDELTGFSTDAHIYFSLVDDKISKKEFGIHNDISHNLIVQIEGNTQIEIWNIKSEDKSKTNTDSLDKPPVIDMMLSPGDIVYIPAYFWHRATSKTKRLSISFPSADGFPKEMCQDRTWLNIEELIK
jgi:hypothetical protein